MLALIPPDRIDEIWALVEPWAIKGADASQKFSADDIYGWLKSGRKQLWVWTEGEVKAIAMTTIMVYAKRKTLFINFVAGKEIRRWVKPCRLILEDFAKANGCQSMELWARPGWRRFIEGYRMTHILLEKDF